MTQALSIPSTQSTSAPAKQPVLSYSTGAGWQVLGHAKTIAQAKALIMKTVGDHSLSLIRKHGFQLHVQARSQLHIELNGGPEGFIFSIGKRVPAH